MAPGDPSRAGERIDPRAEVEALCELGARAPGSDAERRAAQHVAGRLRALGRHVELEALDTWPDWPLAYAGLATIGVGANIASVSSPAAGAVLAALATVVALVDAGGVAPVARRLTGRRASQNVVSFEATSKPGELILVAHLDAGRTGYVHRAGVQALRARLGRPRRLMGGPLQPLALALFATTAVCLARVLGAEGEVLTAAGFSLSVLLLVMIALLLDIRFSPTVPGANDNASGVSIALRVAERLGGGLKSLNLNVLLTGAQESLADGMRSFLRRHGRELDRRRTLIVSIDEVGAGSVRYTTREGPLLTLASHRQLLEICEEIAEDAGVAGARSLANRVPSDAYAARLAGFAAITISARDELDLPPHHHRRSDLPERLDPAALADAEDFLVELIERLDTRLGDGLADR